MTRFTYDSTEQIRYSAIRKSIIILLALSVILFLNSCSGTTELRSLEQQLIDRGLQVGDGNSRIPRHRVNGWSSIDDYNLIVSVGVNDKYLIQLIRPCLGLNSTFTIGFTTPNGGRLDRFENIIVRDPIIGREVCGIKNIFRLEPIPD